MRHPGDPRAADQGYSIGGDARSQPLGRVASFFGSLVLTAFVLAACSAAATPSVTPSPFPARASAGPSASLPPLSEAAQSWCLAHLGLVGADDPRVGDMATVNRLHAGASTPADVANRWAGLSPDQLRRDPAFVLACLAAYAALAPGPA